MICTLDCEKCQRNFKLFRLCWDHHFDNLDDLKKLTYNKILELLKELKELKEQNV